MTATYSTLEEFMAAFPNGGSEGDVVTVGNVIYSWNPYAKNWHGASAGDAHMNLSAMVARGAYSSLSEVEEAYPNGGNAGDYVTVNGVVYLWNDQSNTWAYTGAVRTVSSGQQLAAEATHNVGLYATLLDLWNAYPDGGQEGDYAMIGDAQATAIQYVWDEDLGLWMDTQNSSAGRLNYTFDGDVTVGNNLYVGGVIHAKWLISPYDRLFQRLYAKIRTDIAGVVSDTDRANWNTACSLMHTHDNYAILAGITAADIERWNAGGGGVTPTPTPTPGTTDLNGYTWWGRPMPATKTLTGALENVTNITMSGNIQMGGSISMPTGNITMGSSSQIRIGNAVISYDSEAGALKIANFSGGSMNLYATGGVAALGTGSSGGGGGGGGGDPLTQPLSSINTSGMSEPGPNEDGKTIVWDNTNSVWKYGDAGSATLGTLLQNLKDISASPQDGQMLVYRTNAWGYENVPAFNEAAMWAALDATGEVIDASHIPALNYLPLTGGTVTGTLTVNRFISVPYINLTDSSQQIYSGNKIWNLPSASGTLATEAQLENYVSKSFFNRLFQAFNGTTPVTPNDDTTVIDNIKAMADFWSAGAVAALGTSSGGGGGNANLYALLNSINSSSIGNTSPAPGNVGQCLVYDGNNQWAWATPGSNLAGVSVVEGTGISVSQSGIPFTTAGNRTISISGAWQTKIEKGVTAEGWGNHASAGYAADNAVLHLDNRTETVYGEKTFAVYQNMRGICLNPAGDIRIETTDNGTYYLGYEAGNQNDGFNIMNIKGSTYTPLITGLDSGNVGIGTYTPAHKLDVAGVAHASDRIWSDVSIGAKTTDTEGFCFEWDSNNNAVVVLRANGTPCNFYSMGGVSALGVGSSGSTPSISAMNIGALTVSGKLTSRTAQVQNTLTVGSDNYEGNIVIRGNDGDDSYESKIYQSGDILNIEADSSLDISGATSINGNTSITGTLYVSGTTSLHDMKVGSSGSVIKSITWNSSTSRLDVVIGSNTYSFQPVS